MSAAAALLDGVRAAGLPALAHPLADGGEGTLDILLAAYPQARVAVHTVPGPRGDPTAARIAFLSAKTAVVELAQAAGLPLVPTGARDVMAASTAGVGVLIGLAHKAGAREIIVSLGGSATIDGGLGALRALGARLADEQGAELDGTGADLARVARIDVAGIPPTLFGAIRFAADVFSPLCGPDGAARLFGPQKGASPKQVDQLDAGLRELAVLLGLDSEAPLGAAGGFAAPFQALLGAEVISGIDLVMRMTGFEQSIAKASLCLTGEGRVDGQSAQGKTVAGVAACAARHGVPVVVLSGGIEDASADLYRRGVSAVLPIGRGTRRLEEALAATEADLRWVAEAVCRLYLDFHMEKPAVALREGSA
jgi:glycerate 2-kinase